MVLIMELSQFERETHTLTITGAASENTDINVEHYGFENTLPDKPRVSAGSYPAFRLHFIIGGSLTFFSGEKRTQLKRGDCFLLRPDADSAYQTNPNRPASFYWVSVNGKKCKTYFAEMGFGLESGVVTVPKELRRELQKAFFANFAVHGPLREIIDSVFLSNFLKIYQLMYLAAHRDKEPQKTGVKRKEYVEQALEYINRRYSDPELSVKEIANAIHIHENYLSHTFREEMGLPFREYLSQKRISMSYVLMEKGMTSISEIAYAVGFSDPLYFSKVFKRYNHISPSEHLKKMHTPPPYLNS